MHKEQCKDDYIRNFLCVVSWEKLFSYLWRGKTNDLTVRERCNRDINTETRETEEVIEREIPPYRTEEQIQEEGRRKRGTAHRRPQRKEPSSMERSSHREGLSPREAAKEIASHKYSEPQKGVIHNEQRQKETPKRGGFTFLFY